MQQNVHVDDIFNWWKNHNLSTMQYSNLLQETYNILKEFDLEAEDVTNEQEKVVCNKETASRRGLLEDEINTFRP